MSRRVVLVLSLLAVIAAAAIGWIAGTRIKSPAQIAAEAQPPEASLITVPVERMVIANDVVTRGTVRFDEPESVSAPQLAVPGLSPVVTWVPAAGEEMDEGSVLFELAGRPTFALQGELPLFRTVMPGDEGEDIAQLQTALTRLGFDPGEIDGVYGPVTEGAARAFYQAAGYEPIEPSEAVRAEVEAAEAQADSARDIYVSVKNQQAAAKAAQQKVTDAAADLNAVQANLATAQQRLDTAEAGAHPDTGQPPTEEELNQLEAAVAAADDAVTAAEDALQAALAEAELVGAVQDISAERDALSRAQQDLAAARKKLGSPVPDGEFLFFNVFPIRVDSVAVARGDVAGGEVMSVSGSRLAIDSSLSIDEAELVDVGDPVQIELSRLGISLGGTIAAKATSPGTNGVGIDEVYIEVLPDEVRAELNNTNVKITIPVASRASEGEVLAVPAAALSATGSGDTIVTVEDENGITHDVKVKPGLSAPGGMVEITPVDGELREGDRVVVGVQQQADTTTADQAEG